MTHRVSLESKRILRVEFLSHKIAHCIAMTAKTVICTKTEGKKDFP